MNHPRQGALLSWFVRFGRDLPWRHSTDPWAIYVSEVMLAQTQVARVLPVYESFLARFPTVASCASSAQSDLIVAWAGLGYNRRAAHLHRAARMMSLEFGGRIPDQLGALLSLPGVGPYIARAVLAFAFHVDIGVVDTNVRRVLDRWHGRRLDDRQSVADALVPLGMAWEWNQALFDLGATICTAKNPLCDTCPVRQWCAWEGVGDDPGAALGPRQSRFAGSDRQGRGRLVNALRLGPVPASELALVMDWADDPERAQRVAQTLVVDGLVQADQGVFRLADSDSLPQPIRSLDL